MVYTISTNKYLKDLIMYNIHTEMAKLEHILKQFGQVEYDNGLVKTLLCGNISHVTGKLIYKDGLYKTYIWIDSVSERDRGIYVKARRSSVYYCPDNETEEELDSGYSFSFRAGVIKSGKVYNTTGLLSFAKHIISYINYCKYDKISKKHKGHNISIESEAKKLALILSKYGKVSFDKNRFGSKIYSSIRFKSGNYKSWVHIEDMITKDLPDIDGEISSEHSTYFQVNFDNVYYDPEPGVTSATRLLDSMDKMIEIAIIDNERNFRTDGILEIAKILVNRINLFKINRIEYDNVSDEFL